MLTSHSSPNFDFPNFISSSSYHSSNLDSPSPAISFPSLVISNLSTSQPLHKSSGIKHLPSYLQVYQHSLLSSFTSIRGVDSHVSSSLTSSTIPTLVEPKSYNEAIKHPCWQDVMAAESFTLEANHTWIATSLPQSVNPIGCK